MGRDRVLKKHIKSIVAQNQDMTDFSQLAPVLNLTLTQKFSGIVSTIMQIQPFNLEKMRVVLREDKRRLLLLPLTLPVMLFLEAILTIGSVITYIEPNFLLQHYYKSEEKKLTLLHQ